MHAVSHFFHDGTGTKEALTKKTIISRNRRMVDYTWMAVGREQPGQPSRKQEPSESKHNKQHLSISFQRNHLIVLRNTTTPSAKQHHLNKSFSLDTIYPAIKFAEN